MIRNFIIASGAILLLALGGAIAEARPMGGGGGGHSFGGGGHSFGGRSFGRERSVGGGSFRGGNFSSRSFRGGRAFNPGRNFGPRRGLGNYRNFSRRGPVPGWNGRGRNHWRHHRGRRIIVGAPYFYDYGFYDDYGYYGDNCGWLYRRALSTGSPYWWRRYRDCAY